MTEFLSDERLAELEALAAQATPGPWLSTWDAADGWHSITGAGSEDGEGYYLVCPEVATCEEGGSEDAEFIAASRTALPALLAEVREHRARVAADERDRAALGTTPESVTDAGGSRDADAPGDGSAT